MLYLNDPDIIAHEGGESHFEFRSCDWGDGHHRTACRWIASIYRLGTLKKEIF